MKKKLLLLAGMLVLMLAFTSCGMDMKAVINEDLSSTQEATIYYSEDELKEMIEGEDITFEEATADLTPVEIDGKMYYGTTETEKLSATDTKEDFVDLTKQHMVIQSWAEPQGEFFDEMDVEFVNYAITLPAKVVKTNLTVADDGKTVLVTKDDFYKKQTLYAIYNKDAAASKSITYSGVTKGKIYKVKKYLTITSKNVIKKVAITRNGKTFKDTDYYEKDGKLYDNVYNKFAFVKDGKYTVKTTLVNGAVKSTNFTVDKTKPTTNMKAKTYKKKKAGYKITFKDATSGVKSATLNGKKIKSGKIVKNTGSYTLVITDKAGNKKTVKFKIKK